MFFFLLTKDGKVAPCVCSDWTTALPHIKDGETLWERTREQLERDGWDLEKQISMLSKHGDRAAMKMARRRMHKKIDQIHKKV